MDLIKRCKDILIEYENIIFAYIFGSYVTGKMREVGNPKMLGEAFDILNSKKYLSDEDTRVYKNMVGLRNILSHEYLKIDKKMIYDILKNNLIDIKRFIIFVNDNFI